MDRGAWWGAVHGVTKSRTPLLIATGGSTPLLCLQGVPDLPGAPQDEAGLMRKFDLAATPWAWGPPGFCP